MRGIGEIITPFEHLPPLAAVLINPMVAVPANKTAQVFRKLGATALSGEASRRTPSDFAGPQALLSHMAETGNDLYGPAREIVPEIDTVLDALRSVGHCQLAQLSGGGPTCFGIYADITTAHEAAARLGAACPRWWVRASSLS